MLIKIYNSWLLIVKSEDAENGRRLFGNGNPVTFHDILSLAGEPVMGAGGLDSEVRRNEAIYHTDRPGKSRPPVPPPARAFFGRFPVCRPMISCFLPRL
jgi:hypothetical protein